MEVSGAGSEGGRQRRPTEDPAPETSTACSGYTTLVKCPIKSIKCPVKQCFHKFISCFHKFFYFYFNFFYLNIFTGENLFQWEEKNKKSHKLFERWLVK